MAALSEHLTRGCLSAENPYIADSLMDSVAMRNPLYSVSRERYGGAAEGSASAEGVGVDVSDPGIEPEPSGRAVVGSFTLWRGRKVYELKNHLGNVLAVVSGVKLGVSTATYSPAPVDYYTADVVEMSDYEPAPDPRIGWMLLAKRHWVSGEGYRFGFNGMGGKKLVEAASEVKGEGMSYRTYFRELDSRLARWWSFDPKSTVFESPFAAMGGNPILFTDVLGDSVRGVNAISAERTLGAIRGTFRGDRAVELQSLFRLKADGKTFEGISEGDFVNAVAGLSTEQQQLAYSYFQAINGSNMHSIEVVTPEEIVSCATD